MKHTLIAGALAPLVLAVGLGRATAASAATQPHHHKAPVRHTARRPHHATPAVTVGDKRVFGHRVRVVSWLPGRGIWPTVTYGRPRNVTTWADASNPRGRSIAAMNMSTWTWRTNVPIGTVRSHGRWIVGVHKRPAVGFTAKGRAIFGARPAARHGARNIAAGVATLLANGHIARRYPWAHPAQISCSCYRSVIGQWSTGRVGMIEVGYATMRQAAYVLKRMGVRNAVTGDAGGSSILWTRRAAAAAPAATTPTANASASTKPAASTGNAPCRSRSSPTASAATAANGAPTVASRRSDRSLPRSQTINRRRRDSGGSRRG